MKLKPTVQIIVFIFFLWIPYSNLFAIDKEIERKLIRENNFEPFLISELDSIAPKRMGDKKDQDRSPGGIKAGDKKPNHEVDRPSKGPKQRPGIKQVPRSMPKLKPKTLNDRIPIRRIPMKTPRKGLARF